MAWARVSAGHADLQTGSQVRYCDLCTCMRKIVSVSRVQDVWGAINQLTTP